MRAQPGHVRSNPDVPPLERQAPLHGGPVVTEPPQHQSHAVDGPTRDIRLTPLPDRPGAPGERVSGVPPYPTRRADDEPALQEQPTDELVHHAARPRERTLAFSDPAMSRRPVGPITVGPSRRWPWLLLVLLPMLVIAGAAVALLLLLQGG